MRIWYKPMNQITEADKQTPGLRCISSEGIEGNFGRIGSFEYLPDKIIQPQTKNRVAHVLWSRPAKLDFKESRWNIGNQFELSLPLTVLSLALLKEMNQDVVLYTDNDGAKLLQGLDYDKVYNVLDNINIHNDFWAAGKIIALDNEPLDSILIDTDLFLYDGRILDKANSLKVCGSHREKTDRYIEMLKYGMDKMSWLRGDCQESTNVGILKIEDMRLKKIFIQAYWQGLQIFSNKNVLSEFKKQGHGAYCIDLLIEQFNFHKMCKPEILIDLPEEQKDTQGIVHLISFEKYMKIPVVLDILKSRYPEYYKKVISKWNELNFYVQIDDYKYE